MDFLIIIKWLTNYQAMEKAKPPSVITGMITMSINFGTPDTFETPFIDNQTWWMQFLLIVAFLCVPIMLFVKPIYENSKNKKAHDLEVDDGYKQINTAINNDFSGSDALKDNRSGGGSVLEAYL